MSLKIYRSASDPMRRVAEIAARGLKVGTSESASELLYEYLWRLAQLESLAQIRVSHVFFDPIEFSDSGDEKILNAEREKINEITKSVKYSLCRTLLQNFLFWDLLIRNGNRIALLQPSLFEPLIELFEKGEVFLFHHGEAQFEHYAVPLLNWRNGTHRPRS